MALSFLERFYDRVVPVRNYPALWSPDFPPFGKLRAVVHDIKPRPFAELNVTADKISVAVKIGQKSGVNLVPLFGLPKQRGYSKEQHNAKF